MLFFGDIVKMTQKDWKKEKKSKNISEMKISKFENNLSVSVLAENI